MKKFFKYVGICVFTLFFGIVSYNAREVIRETIPSDSSDYAFFLMFFLMIIGGIGAFVKELPKGKTRVLDSDTSTDIFVSQAELHKYLPNFNMEEFTKYVFESFSKIQTAMSDEDMTSVRNLMTDELYNVYLTQLDLMKKNNQSKTVSDFKLDRVALHRIKEHNGKVSLTISLIWNSKDYITNTKTNEVIRGDRNSIYKTRFLLTYVTNKNAKIEDNVCPNCGASIEINHTAKCKYCDAVVTNSKHSYILAKKQYVSRELLEQKHQDLELTEEEIENKIENIVIQTLYAISTKSVDNVRHFLSDKVEKEIEAKIKELEKNKHTLILEELQTNYSNLKTKEVVNGKYLITVTIWVKGFIYTMDNNGNILGGNDFKPTTKSILVILEKDLNHKKNNPVKRCASCGHNMNINKSGKCEYCGSIYKLEDYDYVVKEFYINDLTL